MDNNCKKCNFFEYCELQEKQKNIKICNDCKHYKVIDSGYGKCFALPPETKYERSKLLGLIKKTEIKIVPWCMKSCALFKRRK